MFISRVLVGDFTKGSSDYRRPPSKDGRGANLYDSCVDDVANPSIYVVFERQQIYPEYLLQYKTSSLKRVKPPVAAPLFGRSTSAQSNTASKQPSNLSYSPNSATYQYPRSPSSSSLPEKKSDSCVIA